MTDPAPDRIRRALTSEDGHPLIMGILNATPDSFSDGGRFSEIGRAVAHGLQMAKDGAEIIDVGGESTRPGSDPVPAKEQIRRVVPLILALRSSLPPDVVISIDTTWAEVAGAAMDAGAAWINDVSAGRDDPEILRLAAVRHTPIVLMHMKGTPKTMQNDPNYACVVEEVIAFLLERVGAALSAGVEPHNIILDPGIGFGKRREDNLALMANLGRIAANGYAVLLGTSRKRFMGSLCGDATPSELIPATVATTAIGVMAGIKIFRVHDVRENRQAVDVAYAIRSAGRNDRLSSFSKTLPT